MRCPSRLAAVFAAGFALSAGLAWASAETARVELVDRFKREHPSLSPADYAWGSAAFDAQLRAAIAENAPAAAPVLDQGKAIWVRKFKNGKSLAGCFPNGGKRIAAGYPQYDPRLKRVLTLEAAINQCLKAHGEPTLEADDPATMGAAVAYVRSLAEKQKVAVRVPAAAEPKFEEGRRLYFTRLGQRNYACASCHVQYAGKRYDGVPLSPALGQSARYPSIRDGRALTLQVRMRECLERMGAAAFPAGSDELVHLEYFLAYLSNGLVLRPNAWVSP